LCIVTLALLFTAENAKNAEEKSKLKISASSADSAVKFVPPGEIPKDTRLGPLKDLDGYFPFSPSKAVDDWNERAERVRRRMRVALGLWPMPTRTPLNAVINGKIDRENYTVEKVYFESYPGFYVTGSLYRPKGAPGKRPGVLSPHGHWANGRFHDSGLENVRQEIVQGAERFEEGGRSPLQSRCVQLARMGCVVFHYDMIGYADSRQISSDIAHGFAKQRPEMSTVESWGLYSPQAEAHLQSVMGLQTWNSVRSLDFLLSLPDVDAGRIGVTGASGGGTQTFILAAIDPRPTVAFPAVMVSTAMQGGCTCENACLLRIGTGNVEFAALFAPKPLGMTAADDWTREMTTKGFPELQKLYQMLSSPHNVMLKSLTSFGHNYNYVSRAAMYQWFNKHLKLGLQEPIVEEDYERLTKEEMSVWDQEHPQPEGGSDPSAALGTGFERRLLRWINDDSQKQLREARKSPAAYREIVGGAIDVIIGRSLSEAGDVVFKLTKSTEADGCQEMLGLLRNETYQEEIPAVLLKPTSWKGQTVLWIDAQGKSGLYNQLRLTAESAESAERKIKTKNSAVSADSAVKKVMLRPEIQMLLDAGVEVVGMDLLFQGEFLAESTPITQTRRVENKRESAAYTFGYNHTLFAQRVHDILSAVKYIKQRGESEIQNSKFEIPGRRPGLALVGLKGAGHWVAAARAQAGGAIDLAAIETAGFRFGKILDIRDVDFLPGGAKYGDLPGIISLHAPGKLWLAGEGKAGTIKEFYDLAGAENSLTISDVTSQDASDTAIKWLLREM
jgi:dienelactone hydrolase